MTSRAPRPRLREPVLGIGVRGARAVRAAIGYARPTELEIEVLCYLRGALVRPSPSRGARANLLRVGADGIIAVAAGLPHEQRRWAIAHELGHFEVHAGVSYVGLCTGEDAGDAYLGTGREEEANAFAGELLMPVDLFAPSCDVREVTWAPITALARAFEVSTTAAALRFLSFTDERVAVVCSARRRVEWAIGSRAFGARIERSAPLDRDSLAYDYFAGGRLREEPEPLAASAWIDGAGDDEEIVEHAFAMPHVDRVMSLLWLRGAE